MPFPADFGVFLLLIIEKSVGNEGYKSNNSNSIKNRKSQCSKEEGSENSIWFNPVSFFCNF